MNNFFGNSNSLASEFSFKTLIDEHNDRVFFESKFLVKFLLLRMEKFKMAIFSKNTFRVRQLQCVLKFLKISS